MPPPVILDPAGLDLDNVVADQEEIMRFNPQRYEFLLLDRVVYFDDDSGIFAGYHDIKPDAWWTRAHIPDRPLFPGVLMIESAAQLSSYATHRAGYGGRFIGFAGVDAVKFRGAVVPPCRLLIVGRATKLSARRTESVTQGFVDGTMVFEAQITGMPI